MHLKIEYQLIIASVRCVLQLTVLAFVLKPLFEHENVVLLLALSTLMSIFGAMEVTFSKVKFAFQYSFLVVFAVLFVVNMSLSMFGTGIIMQVSPFYRVQHFIPTVNLALISNFHRSECCWEMPAQLSPSQ